MKGLTLLLLVFGLLIAGCTQPPAQAPPAQPPAQPPPVQNGTAQPPTSCSEYCQTLPHTQCDGEWKISGTYPNCVCNYECKQATPPAPPNQTNQTPPDPAYTPTNKSVQELLNDGMAGSELKFYKENDGQFSQVNYTWFRYPPVQDGSIISGQAPYTDVEFDGDAISTIQAFGYIVFENKVSEAEKAYGVAIFKAKGTPLDYYTGTDAFEVDYFYQQENGLLRDCWVYTRDYNVNPASEWFVTYFFRCEKVLDK